LKSSPKVGKEIYN